MKKDYRINHGALTIHVTSDSAASLNLEWLGKSVDRNPALFLQPFFDQWTAEAEKSGSSIVMDFTSLVFMNSSTITPIISLIQTLRVKNLALTIRYDRRIKWQQLSFSALRVFTGRQSRIVLDDSPWPPESAG